MPTPADAIASLPRILSTYPDASAEPLLQVLAERIRIEPFNAIATVIFVLAILHTFMAGRIKRWSHDVQHAHDARMRAAGRRPLPSFAAEVLHFLGEVEVVFGLWAIVLFAAMAAYESARLGKAVTIGSATARLFNTVE